MKNDAKNKREEKNYFKQMEIISTIGVESAELLNKMMHDISTHDEMAEQIKHLEQQADDKYHQMVRVLAKDFIPPFEREDIMNLSLQLDSVIDTMEDISQYINMLRVTTVRDEAIEFSELILKMAKCLACAFAELHNYKKPKALFEHLVELNHLESEGDTIFYRATARLFDSNDLLEIIKWRKLFEIMEMCCDTFEDVADCIENIVMKNT